MRGVFMVTNKKPDRRVRKTRAQLKQGLVTLMKQKDIRNITVKELVETVDINRSTFYLHYTDIYEVLDEVEQDLLQELQEILEAHPSDKIEDTFSFITDLYAAFEKNRDVCPVLMNNGGSRDFIHKIELMMEEKIRQRIQSTFGINFIVSPYLYSFYRSGCLGLLQCWLNTEQRESPEEMAKLTYRLVISSIHALHPERFSDTQNLSKFLEVFSKEKPSTPTSSE
jgi:AcrR family transcriptional regulator